MRDLPFDNRAQAAYMVQEEDKHHNKFIGKVLAFFNIILPAKKIILKGEWKSDGKFHLIAPLKLLGNRRYILIIPFPTITQKWEEIKWDITTSNPQSIDIIIDGK